MNILFVCTNNLTRSQMAEVFFNELSNHKGSSAGSRVRENDRDGKTLQQIASDPSGPHFTQSVLDVMEEKGFNLNGTINKQLTPEMAEAADKVIVMTTQQALPSFLLHNDKVLIWDVRVPSR